jgi:serine/threonine-protein kinase
MKRDSLTPPKQPSSLVLDRYQVESLLGEGAYGAVYRGRSARSGQPVAIKIALEQDGAGWLRFEREAALLARIHHPNVVSVLDFGHLEDGCAVVVMELVAGASLDKLLARQPGGLPWREAATIALGLLDGLDAAHEAGVLHRDVKPANVLVIESPVLVAKLIDFGIAREVHGELRKLTRTGELLGSLGYMAPEQLTGDPIDARTDVYAVGSLLYELLCGALPYQGTGMRLATAKVSGSEPSAPPVPAGHEPWPSALGELVLQMLSRARDQRPASAYECADRLRAVTRRGIARSPAR